MTAQARDEPNDDRPEPPPDPDRRGGKKRARKGVSLRSVAFPLPRGLAYSGAILSGLLYWLAFPGKTETQWHGLLALVAFVPLWIAIQGQSPRRATFLGVLAGATMNLAGFYWLLDMLETFGGFPAPICMFFVVVVCFYQGGRLGLMGWLYARAASRGWPREPVFLAAFAASELLYPLLFPWYFAATTHRLPALAQVAELGGPILVGIVLVAVSVALAEPLLAHLERRKVKLATLAWPAVLLAATLAFGAWRIPIVDRQAQSAPPVHVGVAQGNMALLQKREDPAEGLRRHIHLTSDLKKRGADFVVWSESSVTFPVPERSYKSVMRDTFARGLGLPAIFGAVVYRVDADRERWYNTALSTNARGEVTARYDKEFLLAFGEYLPFGESFPQLYDWSPNSGRFSPGTLLDPLLIPVGDVTHRISVLVCYEDILPAFTNKVVRFAAPELLVNITNDAWFGDTSEPWEHLALAQLRAIEHRRYLVRSTNSGVSAFVDPVGRVMLHSDTFQTEGLDAIVHFLQGETVYERIGDGPWWLLTGLLGVGAFWRRKRDLAEG